MKQPEQLLQIQVKRYLTWCLDESVEWTASLAGIHLGNTARGKAKATGSRRGWPDLQFLFPDGITRYIEMKTEKGTLTPEQKMFQVRCSPFNIFAVCRSVNEVEATLRGWGAKLKNHPFKAESYE